MPRSIKNQYKPTLSCEEQNHCLGPEICLEYIFFLLFAFYASMSHATGRTKIFLRRQPVSVSSTSRFHFIVIIIFLIEKNINFNVTVWWQTIIAYVSSFVLLNYVAKTNTNTNSNSNIRLLSTSRANDQIETLWSIFWELNLDQSVN